MRQEEATITPQQKATLLAQALVDRKGQDVVLLDVTQLVDYVDFFLVVTGTSQPHLDAMTDTLQRAAAEAGFRHSGMEGRGSNSWVLLDFGDVVVHLFSVESRGFYALEDLWCDAPRTEFGEQSGELASAN